ncbi:DHS-like NAD/FAD-binding domain-containing protein [Artomyces pyxidatus]|uniref:DHS-like NAD/FAD-binding domain-containing protein n=2 Tax=Artomyces pyxidatus TaxID=48021 RepID=A0ACB8SMJ1_9AGAM|nr:DHS-like NAD/FAD-binding domain-containing protein [Artomyces pyxidatus]KAI0057800.1 DHS-like NAD/FAD-binding domain-containing protein [Artomyces pyxidatus]
MSPSSTISDFRKVLHDSKNIVAVVGAGMSAASGESISHTARIPTWRGSGGVWKTYDPAAIATPQAFAANPSLVWHHYHAMRERHVASLALLALQATPNPAHFALSLLCIPEFLASLAPAAQFTLVTQNIDGLDVRAVHETVQRFEQGRAAPVPAPRVYEMHGRVLDTLCTACGHREHNPASPLCPALAVSELGSPGAPIPEEDLPRCAHCGGLLRPGVVWFEELPHHSREIWAVVDGADLCLLVGTSSQVQPAAAYAYEVADHGGKVAVFNTERSGGDEDREFLFLGPCAETLPRVLINGE